MLFCRLPQTPIIATLLTTLLLCDVANATSTLQVEARRKPGDPWKSYDTRTIEQLNGFTALRKEKRTQFGGLAQGKLAATGFFRTEKVKERWWLIDPEGARFFHVGVTSIRPGTSEASQVAFEAKFGSVEKWADEANALLRRNAFTGTGAFTETTPLQAAPRKVPYTINWNFMSSYGEKRGGTYRLPGHTGYPGKCIFIFDPAFEEFCEQHAKKLAPTKDDPWLLGHFSDNEMPLDDKSLNRYLALPEADHGRKAAERWLAEYRRATPADDITTVSENERGAFLQHGVERYCRIVSTAIRKVDPNHLFLGPRWNGPAVRLPEIYRASGPYVDVHSINYYNTWTPRADRLEMWEHESGKPCIISEFYVKGADSGLGNSSGAGWEVKSQADRGKFYQNYVLQLIESRTCIGWHWFRYMDNDPNEKNADASNQDSNKGIVDVRYNPHTELLASMKRLNSSVYALARYFDARTTSTGSSIPAPDDTLSTGKRALKQVPGVLIKQDITYLESTREEKLDLYLPVDRTTGTLSPAVLFIHGGGWAGGDKAALREYTAGITLGKAGYVCASVEYMKTPGKRWPTNLHDCKNAIRYLRKNAAELQIDPDRIGVMGGSAGGHLALMVAYTSGIIALDPQSLYPGISNDVSACVNFYGITNLLTRQRVEKDGTPTGRFTTSTALFTVSRDEDPELWKTASPVTYVTADVPPTLILHGTADATVDRDQAKELARKLKDAGAEHELHMIPDGPHSFSFASKTLSIDIRPIVIEFLDKHLKKAP